MGTCFGCDKRGPIGTYCPKCAGTEFIFDFGTMSVDGSKKENTILKENITNDKELEASSHNHAINNATLNVMDTLTLEENTPMLKENIDSQSLEDNKLESTYNYSVESYFTNQEFFDAIDELDFRKDEFYDTIEDMSYNDEEEFFDTKDDLEFELYPNESKNLSSSYILMNCLLALLKGFYGICYHLQEVFQYLSSLIIWILCGLI